jgi:replicative DNA helicase
MSQSTTKKKRLTSSLQSFYDEHGRMPPQAIELEESVLGAVLIEKDALNPIVEILKPESFYKEAHQIIYEAILDLYTKQEPIDTLTVVENLRKNGKIQEVGGPAYVAQLTRKVLSSANIEYHGRIILQKFIQRELIRISSDIIKQSYAETTDVFDLLNEAEEKLFSISENHLRQNSNTLTSLLLQAREQIEIAGKKGDGLSGVPSGFTDLDRLTSGWQNSDLTIIAARPSMGKTAFVLSVARNIAVDLKRPIAIFSLEMSAIQLATRLLSTESQVSSDNIRKGNLDEDEKKRINIALNTLSEAPIFIDDTAALTLFELRTKCRRLKQKNHIEMVIIDYLQLMAGDNDRSKAAQTREQEISNISRAVKGLAKELNVPILCLSQLSRNVEKRTPPRPVLSDLRESGSIEQDADIVLFLFRPEYYDLTPENGISGSAEIIISKHRNGPTGKVFLKFIDTFAQFKDIESYEAFSMSESIPHNEDFDSKGSSVTMPSKMNKMDNEPDF